MPAGTSPSKRSAGASLVHAVAAESRPALSAYASTSADDREAILRLVHHLSVLMKEVHTPYLDGLVMEKYVIRPLLVFAEAAASEEGEAAEDDQGVLFFNAQDAALARERALANVVALVNLITEHKQRTLEVLEAVSKREHAWGNLQSALASTTTNNSGSAPHGNDTRQSDITSTAGGTFRD